MLLKNRNRFGVALKVAIVFLAAFYIAWRLVKAKEIDFSLAKIYYSAAREIFLFLLVLILMPVNWLLESLKWKLIASVKIKISTKEALKGVLAGVTIGTATPNRVGEFAGRVFMIEEGNRVDLLFLSFISSFCQVFVTIIFGFLAFIVIEDDQNLLSPLTFYFSIFLGILFCSIPFWIKYLPQKWKNKMQIIVGFPEKKLILALFISAVRYLVYVSQFVILLYILDSHDYPNLKEWFWIVMISYFIVTLIPTFSFTEVFVRGTVAGTIFENYHESCFTYAFCTAVVLWTINVAVPSLIGSIFVLKLKFFKSEKE